jgi:hypothetical protein
MEAEKVIIKSEIIRAFDLWRNLPGHSGWNPEERFVSFYHSQSPQARQSARTFKTAYPRWCVVLDGWTFLA